MNEAELTLKELRAKRRWERRHPGGTWPGYKFSPENREKMANKPREVGELTRYKISNSLKGKKHSAEHCEKLSKSNTGKPSPRKGCVVTEITREKLRVAMTGKPGHGKGSIRTLESRKKVSIAMQGITPEEWVGFAKGKNYCWKWYDPKLKVRKRVRAFQGNVCIECGCTKKENQGQFLTVHHVGHDKNACCSGDNKEWLFVLLCTKDHSKLQSDRRASDEKYQKLVKEKYLGKCMYTLEEYNELVATGKLVDSDYGRRDGR